RTLGVFQTRRRGEEGKRGNTVGTYLCADLACSTLIRITPPESEDHPDPERIVRHKAVGMRQRLENFSNRVLSVDA
ncbi:MAG: FBP domain-containing protein, partial [Pontimonas sp.]|nr:FBP domain-containing protein [Pontimonas sp.]